MYKKITIMLLMCSFMLPMWLLAHGYVIYPSARQVICEKDGGFWWPSDGSGIPNPACREAFKISGAIPLQQKNEFSAITKDYYNIEAVKRSIPDGSLCSAGDKLKDGMNVISQHWQKTEILANSKIKLELFATAEHEPNFFEIYITKDGIDVNKGKLKWSDLELVYMEKNVVAKNSIYSFDVQMPDRTGNAIVYTRWQRVDSAGEGFYNCSDIKLVKTSSLYTSLGYMIPQGLSSNKDVMLQMRIFNAQGSEQIDISMIVKPKDLKTGNWSKAILKNSELKQFSDIKIGVMNQNGEIKFDDKNLINNKVYSKNKDYKYVIDLKEIRK